MFIIFNFNSLIMYFINKVLIYLDFIMKYNYNNI